METGETVYLILLILLTPISFGAMAAVLYWFITQKSDTEQAGRVDAIWSHRRDWGEGLCRQLINRQLAPQMTPEMVRLAWGQPPDTETHSATEEVWNYVSGKVTFSSGQVAVFSGEAPKTGRNPVWFYIAILLALALMVSVITLVVIFLAH